MHFHYYLHQQPTNKYGLNIVKITQVLFIILFFSTSSFANKKALLEAELAFKNKNYEQAEQLFIQIKNKEIHVDQALYGLARVAFEKNNLDTAEDFISEAIKIKPKEPEYLFIAARIAGKKAQSASIFSKMIYAKNTKNYFTRALDINKQHVPSIIGLIKFHQQAPSIAGGDKDLIPQLIIRLRELNKREAFKIEAPILFSNKDIKKLFSLYNDALKSSENIAEFQFDFTMMLSSYNLYHHALNELMKIKDLSKNPEMSNMRLYQLGKLAAESKTELQMGLDSMKQYSALKKKDKTISEEWIQFRIIQLQYLLLDQSVQISEFNKLMRSTKDKDLNKKIKLFLKESNIEQKS